MYFKMNDFVFKTFALWTFFIGKELNMAEEQTIMERLFRTLDDKAKSLNEENGQSFIENLGLAMEDVYRNQRTY